MKDYITAKERTAISISKTKSNFSDYFQNVLFIVYIVFLYNFVGDI